MNENYEQELPLEPDCLEAKDKHFIAAVEVASKEGVVCISFLQRRLGYGYTRAALILDRMIAEGMVGEYIDEYRPLRKFIAPVKVEQAEMF